MTALAQYQRLEAAGTWRPAPLAQRREVIVSFGNATLVLSDPRSETPLSHWSLPAVTRLNPGHEPARYAPHGGGADEELEVADRDMIAAIDKVHRAIEQARPHPGRLRGAGLVVLAVLAAAGAAWWLPGAMIGYAARIAPPAQRLAIGEAVLADMARLTGPVCARPAAEAVLSRVATRLLGPGGRLAVLPDGLDGARPLPGGIVAVGRGVFEGGPETREAALGRILAADVAAAASDPLPVALAHAGPKSVLRLLTSGAMPAGALAGHGAAVMASPEPRPADDPLLLRFEKAGIPSEPYARALDPSGEATLGLIEADPFRTRLPPSPALSDEEWHVLGSICDA